MSMTDKLTNPSVKDPYQDLCYNPGCQCYLPPTYTTDTATDATVAIFYRKLATKQARWSFSFLKSYAVFTTKECGYLESKVITS